MAEQSQISDSTFNPWTMRSGSLSRTSDTYWRQPVRWNKYGFFQCECGWRGGCNDMPKKYVTGSDSYPSCPQCGKLNFDGANARRRVFCASLSDWLDNEAPIEWLVDLLDLIRRTPELDWLMLSKRIGNWSRRISEALCHLDEQTPTAYPLPLRSWLCHWLDGDEAPANVWLGATICNQQEADRDIPKLLDTPARVRFLSIEPMLGSVDLMEWWLKAPTHCERCDSSGPCGGRDFTTCPWGACPHDTGANRLDWIICGGESGPNARDNNFEACARDLMQQCRAAGVPFFGKQNVGKKALPDDLRVREFPR